MGNIMREEITSLDLNQVPLSQPQNSVVGRIEEFVVTHGVVEGRVRETEEVDSRPPIVHVGALAHVSTDTLNEGGLFSGDNNPIEAQERVTGNRKSNTMNGAHLIAKALAIESDKVVAGCPENGGFFDCNVCFDMAVEPILTCCGHLFCWPCFYHLPCDHSDVKECPVCGGEVTVAGLVPIYGNGDGNCPHKLKDSGFCIPPRPWAQRVESVRQKRVNRGRIEERILRLTNMIGRVGERTSSFSSQIRTSQPLPSNESSANQYHDAVRISSAVPRAASLTSLSSALNSASDPEERLADELEAYSNGRAGRSSNNNQQSLHVDAFADAASVFASTALADSESSDIAAGSSSTSLSSVLSLGLDINSPVPGSENQTANREIEETEFSSSASWTAPGASRVPDEEIHGVQRETRRRRLR